MSNLALDFGNTRIKAASFINDELTDLRIFTSVEDLVKSRDFILNHKHIIIASVTDDHLKFISAFGEDRNCIIFTSNTPIPIVNSYKSASTLGSDRIAASIGSYTLHPNSNVLTIDCGTCIKYNFVNNANEYLGGGISPGLSLRFKSLNDYTAKLPLVAFEENFSKLIGENTEESILSGVIQGTVKEVDGIIEAYKQHYPDLIILLTGGNGDFFAKRLKNSIFAHPNLVLKGLNKILQFNFEKK